MIAKVFRILAISGPLRLRGLGQGDDCVNL